MKKGFAACLAIAFSLLLVFGAFAESITLTGKVIPADTVQIYAPVSGTVENVAAEAGQRVQPAGTLYTMKTTKVYAENDGRVAGIFGRPGDDAETVSAEYGAVMYLEGTVLFTVNASTDNAFAAADTKFVHTGETVWLVCRSNSGRKGTGIITGISSNSYTIQVTESNFLHGDTVDVFRDEANSANLKLGRGSVSRTSPIAVNATGGIVRIAVEDGSEVKRGDLLLETLDGTYDGYVMPGTEICAGWDGVLGSISVSAGNSVEKGSVAAEIYPMDRMRVEATVSEAYVGQIQEGDEVMIEMDIDSGKIYPGRVVLISAVAVASENQQSEEDTGEVNYRIVAEFVPDEAVRFGMTALMTAGQEDETEQEAVSEEETAKEETAEETLEDEQKSRRPEGKNRPERPAAGEQAEMPEESDPGSGKSSENAD